MIVLTSFAKKRLVRAGFREDQVVVVPNPTSLGIPTTARTDVGEYVAFAGRVSPEKGLDTFLAAAGKMPHVPFKVAGDGPALSGLMASAPRNVEFVGRLDFDHLVKFYRRARVLVVPSRWYEPFGMVVVDAMALGVPVVASRIGGLPYVVDDGVTGMLFQPGDAEDLVAKVRDLWTNADLCHRMGAAGQAKVMREYSQDGYCNNLLTVYDAAISSCRKTAVVDLHMAGQQC